MNRDGNTRAGTLSDPYLEVRDVDKTYPGEVIALKEVRIGVAQGTTLVLIGESGCGKSTLLRLFNRLTTPSRGSVRIRGRDLCTQDVIDLRRSIGYVQQDGGLLPHWTVERNVSLVPRLLGWSVERCHRRVEELLDLVGLSAGEHGSRFPVELSGGQRQRVAFARALAADPEVILLDEPFGALDALTRNDLQHEFLRLRRKVGKTIILVTHDLDEAFRLGDEIAVMKEGRVLQVATPDKLRKNPEGGYVRELLERARVKMPKSQ